MKKIVFFLLILLILFSIKLNAQDWQFFPLGQVSYYSADDEIMEFCFDSIVVKGEKHTYYSKSLRNYSIDENCDSSIMNSEYISNLFPKPRINIYSMRNDTIIYEYDRFGKADTSKAIYIPLNMVVGDTIICNHNITIICYSEEYKDILKGIKDSVKYFDFFRDGKFISDIALSKNYGLIEFFDFRKLLVDGEFNSNENDNMHLQLVGIKLHGQTIGASAKNFKAEDIFDMKIGDEKYWMKFEYGEITYVKDKLIELKDSINGRKMLFSIYLRKIYNKIGSLVNYDTYYEYYNKKLIEKILDYRENIFFLDYFYYGKYLELSDSDKLLFSGGDYLNITDSTLTFGFNPLRCYYNGIIVLNNCNLGWQTDTNGEKIYCPYIGLAYYWYDNMYPFGCTYDLIGFKMNEEIYGDVPEFLTSAEETYSEQIRIFPNPATSTITLTGVSEGVSECEIYDVLGEKVMYAETRHALSLQQIDVSALPPGVYFIRIGDVVQKFVKI
ncbi:MAG: hypothetical protein A2X64_09270 [Ignavibacteria bacterium GWF2_33_9]|nr:MAG: hypothetical protein A2X64_09270 [Ignavibacteria bacterium GWF2_33_9]